MNPISHWKAKRLVLASLDETLAPRRQQWLDHHMEICRTCRKFQALHQRLAFDLEVLVNQWPVAPEFHERVASRLPAHQLPASASARGMWRQDWREFWGPVLAMATVVVFIWTGAMRKAPYPSVMPEVRVIDGSDFLVATDSRQKMTTFQDGSSAIAQGGVVTFVLPKIECTIENRSQIVFRGLQPGRSKIDLNEGSITATVVPGTPFVVSTPFGEVRVKGTKFRVSLEASPTQGGKDMKRFMQVMVMAGLVELVNSFGSVTVAVGQQATAPEGKAPSVTAPVAGNASLGFEWKTARGKPGAGLGSALMVASVKPSSAAAAGKFQKDDVIVAVEGEAVRTAQAFDAQVAKFSDGQKLKVNVQRQEKELVLWLTLPIVERSSRSEIPSLDQLTPDSATVEQQKELKMRGSLFYKDGQLYTGTARYGLPRGVLGVSIFRNGKQMGFVEWQDGIKLVETEIEGEGGHGHQIWYHKNGVKKIEVTFQDGKRMGEERWNEMGDKIFP